MIACQSIAFFAACKSIDRDIAFVGRHAEDPAPGPDRDLPDCAIRGVVEVIRV